MSPPWLPLSQLHVLRSPGVQRSLLKACTSITSRLTSQADLPCTVYYYGHLPQTLPNCQITQLLFPLLKKEFPLDLFASSSRLRLHDHWSLRPFKLLKIETASHNQGRHGLAVNNDMPQLLLCLLSQPK